MKISFKLKKNYDWKKRIILATPFICLIVYLLLGFYLDIWHPTWVIFFLVLIIPEILDENAYETIYPSLCIITYVVLGITLDMWHPLWIIFITIPIYYILFAPLIRGKLKKVEKREFTID